MQIYDNRTRPLNSSNSTLRLTLKAPTIDHLCKSILFENTRYTLLDESSDPLDPANSRFYLVVVQYTDKINSQKLNNYVQHELGGGKLGRKKYNFRLAPEDSAAELTGFIRNGVSPFGELVIAIVAM